jgi:hypothetical protein
MKLQGGLVKRNELPRKAVKTFSTVSAGGIGILV